MAPDRPSGGPAPPASEGDVNLSPAGRPGGRASTPRRRALLDEDARYFLHQSLSTPCLDVHRARRGRDADRRRRPAHSSISTATACIRSATAIRAWWPRSRPSSTACRSRRGATPTAPPSRWPAGSSRSRPAALGKVLFAPSGAAAIGMALKLARYATGRHKTLSMWDSFHGANLDAISVGGEALFRRDARSAAARHRARAAAASRRALLRPGRARASTASPTTSTTCWRCRAMSRR